MASSDRQPLATAEPGRARARPRARGGPLARWRGGLVLAAALGAAHAGHGAAPLEAEREAEMLMQQGIDLARGVLLAGSGLRPFAFVMRPDGKVQRLVPAVSEDMPAADELLVALETGLRQQAESGALRSSAVFVDVVVAHEGSESGALQARLEHSAGYCVDVFYLYSRDEAGALQFQPPITRARQGTVFAGCGRDAEPTGAGSPRYPPEVEEATREGDESP